MMTCAMTCALHGSLESAPLFQGLPGKKHPAATLALHCHKHKVMLLVFSTPYQFTLCPIALLYRHFVIDLPFLDIRIFMVLVTHIQVKFAILTGSSEPRICEVIPTQKAGKTLRKYKIKK